MAQHGAYFLLLCHYYINGPLPANAQQLFIVCSAFAQAEQDAVLYVVDHFFEKRGEFYHNQRADEELEKRSNISIERKLAAAKSLEVRKQKHQQLHEQLFQQTPQQTPNHSQSQSHIQHQDQKLNNDSASAVSKRGSRIPADFSISPEMRSWALANKLPNPDDHICEFVDYWTAKPGIAGYKLDWQATFRNWLRRVPQYNHGGNGNGNGISTAQRKQNAILESTIRAKQLLGLDH